MPVTIVLGAQWGDEGKGKIVDLLTSDADLVARYQGGNNAGHTVVVGEDKYVLHLLPSGILHDKKRCVLGNGMVIEPLALQKEITDLVERGKQVKGRIFLSENAQMVMPYHKLIDQLQEENRGDSKIGTTKLGIGPAYVDKVARVGLRLGDILDKDVLREKIKKNLELKSYQLKDQQIDVEQIVEDYYACGQQIKEYLVDTSLTLDQAIQKKEKILLEGAQGTMLDIDWGTYPYVTSSHPTAGGACTGLGIGPSQIDSVIGVAKAYTTRVGEGPLPTELDEEMNSRLRAEGNEFGATTGRARRCGWFDAVVVRYAARINGLTDLVLTKLDVLDKLPIIKICTGYQYRDQVLYNFPTRISVLEECTPIYEDLPGWQEDTTAITEFKELPANALNYIHRIEELVGRKIFLVSVGAKRTQAFWTRKPFPV